ncbi:MAG: ABC transporter permease [Cytophagales bacterium]|nr:ABC transporter permease [Cytophagales bacterium]
MKKLRLIYESFRFAYNALKANLLRTILSLLGIFIGIFSIIGVLTFIDSLERDIKNSMEFLGTDIIYFQKWPFVGGPDFKWWEYVNRPQPTYNEFTFLKRNLKNASAVSFMSNQHAVVKRKSNSAGRVEIFGVTFEHSVTFDVKIALGRDFLPHETDGGRDVALLGHQIQKSLFPNGENPIGKTIKVKGKKYTVIGTMKEEGDSFLGGFNFDEIVTIPYRSYAKIFYTGPYGDQNCVVIKGTETDTKLSKLEGELTGLIRKKRAIKPTEKNNFELNRPEAVTGFVSGIFGMFNIGGWIIGGLALLVGGFGIANIMFVSVKERTNLIGIQKALGAKRLFILSQFIFEAVVLCLIGGAAGLILIFLITFIPFGTLNVILSFKNIIIGIGVSSFVGAMAGLAPALKAAQMDPVEAIRTA